MWAALKKLKKDANPNPVATLKKIKNANPDHVALGTAVGLLTTQFAMWCTQQNSNKDSTKTQPSNSKDPGVGVDFGVDGLFIPRK